MRRAWPLNRQAFIIQVSCYLSYAYTCGTATDSTRFYATPRCWCFSCSELVLITITIMIDEVGSVTTVFVQKFDISVLDLPSKGKACTSNTNTLTSTRCSRTTQCHVASSLTLSQFSDHQFVFVCRSKLHLW